MAAAGDLNKIDGDIWYAADNTALLNAMGKNFLDNSQLIFNADYIGWNAQLHNTGVPNLSKVFYSTFQAEDADTNYGFVYSSGDDLYALPDLSTIGTEYVIVEATSLSAPWTGNNCLTMQFDAGKWLIYCTTGTDAVRRAQIHKSLWYGTTGADALIDDFTSVTAVKTSHANDVDKRAIYAKYTDAGGGASSRTGTFTDTTNNNNSSFWTNLTAVIGGAQGGTTSVNAEFANGNQVNIASVGGGPGTATSLELGTDTSADELTNPADCDFNYSSGSNSTASCTADIVILCEGVMTWTGTGTFVETDYTTDDSIPVMTAAGTLASEGAGTINTLIFKDTASESVTNAIASINSTIDATSSEQISISADGGSNYTAVNNGEIARPTAGTALWRKIVITRATLDKLDTVSEQACKYNFY